MFLNSAQKKKSSGGSPPEAPRTVQHTGRERLRFVDAELKRANEAIVDLEQRVARLGSIISEF